VLALLKPANFLGGCHVAPCAVRGGIRAIRIPKNRLLIGSAAPDRVGVGSGMLPRLRLVGQMTGSAMVAVELGLTRGELGSIVHATHIALGMSAMFAASAMGLRLIRRTATPSWPGHSFRRHRR
jgi:hypothetical protein